MLTEFIALEIAVKFVEINIVNMQQEEQSVMIKNNFYFFDICPLKPILKLLKIFSKN